MHDDVSLGERGRRKAENEAMFREVNERVAALNTTFSAFTEEFVVTCECDNASCTEQLRMRPGEYEAVRADATRFVVVPGHESPDVETTVEEHSAYYVVEKKPGDPAKVAIETDPRA